MTLPPPRLIGTLDWAERHIRLDGQPFVAADYPWLTDIARAVDQQRNAVFGLVFPPQLFKTLFVQLRLLRDVAVDPGRALLYCVTGKDAADLADEKLFPLIDSTPAVSRHFTDDPDKRGSKRLYRFTDAPVSLLSAETRAHRNSRSGRDLYLDEAWQYEPGALREIFARSDSYEWQRRIIITSTGPTETDAVDTLWKQSARNEWRVVCLHCRQRVPLEFGGTDTKGGLKWDSDEWTREPSGHWREPVAKLTTRWVCPACGECTKYSREVLRQLNDPARGAGYEQTNPKPDPRIHFWHAEAAVFRNWEDLVGEWLTAANAKKLGNMELIEEFVRKKKCISWNPAQLVDRTKGVPEGDYALGDVWPAEGKDPQGRPIRTMFVDVQMDHFWVVIRQWSTSADTYAHSRLLHFGKLHVEGQIEDLRLRFEVPAESVVMDARYNTEIVRQICARWGYFSAKAVDDRSFLWTDGVRRIHSMPTPIDAFMGGGLQGRHHAWEFIYSFTGAAGLLQSATQAKDLQGRHIHTIARDTPEEYRRQRLGQIYRRKRHPKNPNEFSYEWTKIGPDHAWDCEKGLMIQAARMGLTDSTPRQAAEGPENKTK